MDNRQVLDKLTSRTRAVFMTHVLGYNALTPWLVEELEARNVPLIEDVCESHGAALAGRKLGTPEVRCKLISDGVGAITTADVNLAFAERTNPCVIMGFGVIAESKARALAKEKGIDIRTHSIIYDLLNDM